MKESSENFVQCEVCGTETSCIETKDGMCVCSKTCKRIAEGTDMHGKIPLDIMFQTAARNYVGL